MDEYDLQQFMGRMPLASIFYGRFDNKIGQVIDHQYPLDVFHPSLLPSKLFCANYGKVLTVKTHKFKDEAKKVKVNYKIVSCPERIWNETKYSNHRNQFIFNIGLVLRWEGDDEPDDQHKEYYRSSPLVPLVKKISEDLRALEMEFNYLSEQIKEEPLESNRPIKELCKNIFDDLKKYGMVDYGPIPAHSYRIHLRVFPSAKVPPEVRLHHVPVFQPHYQDKRNQIGFSDLTASALIREIDGTKHIHRICGDKVSPELACWTVRDLIFKDICYIRDIFQYTNRYASTPKLQRLYQSFIEEKRKHNGGNAGYSPKSVVAPFLNAIRLDRKQSFDKASAESGPTVRFRNRYLQADFQNASRPSFYDVFRFLCAMSLPTSTSQADSERHDYQDAEPPAPRRLREILVQHQNIAKTCNVKKLVEYATKEGWIRRVHEYPAISVKDDEPQQLKSDFGADLNSQNKPEKKLALTISQLSGLMVVSSEFSIEELCATYKTSEKVCYLLSKIM